MPTTQIPNRLFFRIGEVCKIVDIEPFVLRFWETEFPNLAPEKSKAGHRVYKRKDIEMVLRIKELLYERGYTIARRLNRDVAQPGSAYALGLCGRGTLLVIQCEYIPCRTGPHLLKHNL